MTRRNMSVGNITRETVEINEGKVAKKVHRYAEGEIVIAEVAVDPEAVDVMLFLKDQNVVIKDREMLCKIATVLKDMCEDKCLKILAVGRPVKEIKAETRILAETSAGRDLWSDD
jgi:hypothetical protein